MKKIFILSALVIFIITGCEKQIINQPEMVAEIESSESTDLGLKTDQNSIFYVDWVDPNNPSGPGLVTPEIYFVKLSAQWGYNKSKTKYVASGSVRAKFYTQFGDKDGGSNSLAQIQIMLVKNGQIFESITTEYPIKYGEQGIVYSNSAEEFIDYSGNFMMEFPFSEDLDGVSIVAQGYMMGCFAYNEEGQRVGLSYAKDIHIPFNLTVPEPDPDPVPTTPTNLTIDESFIILSWDASQGADRYKIYRKMDYFNWELIGTTTSTSYRDFSVIPGPDINTFWYKVQAENSSGVSYYSNIVSTMGNTFD